MIADYRAAIVTAATAYHLDPLLVEALVEHESGGNPFAWNPEPRYHYLWNLRTKQPFRAVMDVENTSMFPPQDFPMAGGDRDQEWWGQKASWGLCQVMGAVAREQGFTEPYLTALVDPDVNLEIGCRVLAGLVVWARGRSSGGLAAGEARRQLLLALGAFNAGKGGARTLAGSAYGASVLARYDRLRGRG